MKNLAHKLDCPEAVLTAIELSKCDLQTELTQSFPELQGYIGSFYARSESFSEAICIAIEMQYKLGIEESPEGKPYEALMLALIEKIEKISTLLKAGEVPTSSRDPFGIRRDALAIVKILSEGKLDLQIEFADDIKNLILERLEFYLKNKEKFAFDSVIKKFAEAKKISIFQMVQDVSFIEENKLSILEYKRIFNILSSPAASEIINSNEKIAELTAEEKEFFKAVSSSNSLQDYISNANLISPFFEKHLIINKGDLPSSKAKLVEMKKILEGISRFISF